MAIQFTVGNGVKQEGVPSPILFTVYIDNLNKFLKQKNGECKIGNNFLGLFGYADDLTMLCPTLSGLREMLIFLKDDNMLLFKKKKQIKVHGKYDGNCHVLLFMSNVAR